MTTTEKAATALELLPEEMREPAVQYLLEQAEKFRVLKELVSEGMDEVAQARFSEWNFQDFLREARASRGVIPAERASRARAGIQ
jgi:hypothetical protein